MENPGLRMEAQVRGEGLDYDVILKHGMGVVILRTDETVFSSLSTGFRVFRNIKHATNVNRFVLARHNMPDAFYDMNSGFTNELMNKCALDRFKIAVVGDFSDLDELFQKFIRKVQRTDLIYFTSDEDDAVEHLSYARA